MLVIKHRASYVRVQCFIQCTTSQTAQTYYFMKDNIVSLGRQCMELEVTVFSKISAETKDNYWVVLLICRKRGN